jgi:hypothetical protein
MPIFVVEGASPAGEVVRRLASFVPTAGSGGFAVCEASSEAGVREACGGGAAVAVWAAVALAPTAPARGRDLYVVDEVFDPPIDLSKAAPENPELSPCLQRHDVDWVTSFIALDGTRCRCVYDAADAEAVRASYRAAKFPFVRVWRARREA